MRPVPHRRDVAGSAPGRARLGSHLYRMVGRGALWTADEIKLMADYLGTDFGPNVAAPPTTGRRAERNGAPRIPDAARRQTMRELVVKYLSKGISRRGFVTGLTKAGLTMTAAQSVLASVSTVTRRRPARRRCPRRHPPARPPPVGRAGEGVPGPRRRRLRRAAHRLGREIRVRQFGERRRAVLRGAGRPPAAQIHPDAA